MLRLKNTAFIKCISTRGLVHSAQQVPALLLFFIGRNNFVLRDLGGLQSFSKQSTCFMSTSNKRMSQDTVSHHDPSVNAMAEALRLAKSSGASPEVIKSIQSAMDLVDLKEEFTLHATSNDSAACKSIVKATREHDWKAAHDNGKTTWNLDIDMMSSPLEGQFLKSLVSIQKPKRILDIGMFTGYSALAMAEALPVDGELVTLDMDEYLRTFVSPLITKSPHHRKIKIIIGNARDLVKQMSENGEQFDMIFLDADKGGYQHYLKYAFEGNLLRAGGTVLADNAFMLGDGYLPSKSNSNTRKFADAVAADPSLHKVLVPLRDGVLMIRRMAEVEGTVA